MCDGGVKYAPPHSPPRANVSFCMCLHRSVSVSGFIPALVEKRPPLAVLITIPPRSKDTVVIDGLNVYLARIGFDPGGSAMRPLCQIYPPAPSTSHSYLPLPFLCRTNRNRITSSGAAPARLPARCIVVRSCADLCR